MELFLIFMLVFIFISLLSIERLLKKKLDQSKALEEAIKKLIEITKNKP